MTILPGLTSTEKDRIPAFVDDLRHSDTREIALFPTVLTRDERRELYGELSAIEGLRVPHVHLRSDCDESEMEYLVRTFSTEAFNIHPSASRHPFGPVPPAFARRVFVENVDVAAADEELAAYGGICADYAHLENARLVGREDYVTTTERQLASFTIGCCHVSAIRLSEPNQWSGGADHHNFRELADLDYMSRYARVLPVRYMSLELENCFADHLRAVDYLSQLLDLSVGEPTRHA